MVCPVGEPLAHASRGGTSGRQAWLCVDRLGESDFEYTPIAAVRYVPLVLEGPKV